jgi:voltage-gated potassium channel
MSAGGGDRLRLRRWWRRRRAGRGARILFTKAEAAPQQKLVMRLGIVALLLAAVVALFWFDRSGLRDARDGEISFGDVIYFTMVTITTVGYGDIVPVSDRARLLDAFLVTPVRVFLLLIFLGTAYEFVIQKVLEDYRMGRLQRRLRDHIVICGYGHSGRIAARELVAKGCDPDCIVVIDLSEDALYDVAEAGYVGLRGDATHEGIIRASGIERARAAIVSPGRDDTNVLIVLTIRSVSPAVKIIASVKEEENFKLIEQSGANMILSPAKVSGYLLAEAVLHRHTSDYVCDLVTSHGRVKLNERPARPEEVGRGLRDVTDGLVVGIQRDGKEIGFWHAEAGEIQAGDVLLLIEPTDRTHT